jgi:hypothetical protein
MPIRGLVLFALAKKLFWLTAGEVSPIIKIRSKEG